MQNAKLAWIGIKQRPNIAMRKDSFPSDAYLAIPGAAFRADPEPTALRLLNLAPKSISLRRKFPQQSTALNRS